MTKLYTDTSANLPLALLREYDIAVIPFSYTVNGVAEDYSCLLYTSPSPRDCS